MKTFIVLLIAAGLQMTFVQAQTSTPPPDDLIRAARPKHTVTPSPTPDDGLSRAARPRALKEEAAQHPTFPPVALAPSEIPQLRFTTHSQPRFFWYQQYASDAETVLTISDGNESTTVAILPKALRGSGIYSIRPSQWKNKNFHLKFGVEYQWRIAFVSDTDRSGLSRRAFGPIRLTEPGAKNGEHIAWYDELEAISDAIDAAPRDKSLHRQRAALLEKAGLKGAAVWDGKQ